jgi:hypothetical protein
MRTASRRRFYINLGDWTWWAWAVTTALLIAGLSGYPSSFIAAMALTVVQGIIMLARDRDPRALSVQVRAGYLLLLVICYLPGMRWLYWLPTIGAFALTVVGYCLLVRVMSLLPWYSQEAYTLSRLQRTFFSAPDLDRVKAARAGAGCAGALCTIEAQIAPDESPCPFNRRGSTQA